MAQQDHASPVAGYVWTIRQVPDAAIQDLSNEVCLVLERVFRVSVPVAKRYAAEFAEEVRSDKDGLGLMSLHSTPLQVASSFAGAYDRPLSDDELARYDALMAERSTLRRSA